jgi:hypothetical protein
MSQAGGYSDGRNGLLLPVDYFVVELGVVSYGVVMHVAQLEERQRVALPICIGLHHAETISTAPR